MFFLFLFLSFCADPHEDLHTQLDSIEQQLQTLENLDQQVKALKSQTTNQKKYPHKYGDEKKDFYLSGINTKRTEEYKNMRTLKNFFSTAEDGFIIDSPAPILSFKARTPTFASEILVTQKKKADCNIRQAVFTFMNHTEPVYTTNTIDFSQESGTQHSIKLNTEVEFTSFEMDIPLNWGADCTCLPEIFIYGPKH